MFSRLSDRWKDTLAVGGILTVLGGAIAFGYKANAIEMSKTPIKVFAEHKEKEEKKVNRLEVTTEFLREDAQWMKNQIVMIAIATHATIVPPPLPKSDADGGVK